MAKIIAFERKLAPVRKPYPKRLRAPWGADIFLVRYGSPPHESWTVFDESPSGGSAGSHGNYDTLAEAICEGQKLAAEVDGTFRDGGSTCP